MTRVLIELGLLVVAFGAGLVLSQKVKDWVKGIPGALRADLNRVEEAALNRFRKSGPTGPTGP